MSGIFVKQICDEVEVEGEEYIHLTRSLRKREGEFIWLTDGKGTLAEGYLLHVSDRKARVRVVRRHERIGEPPTPIGLLLSPLHQPSRMDWLVEKAVELGATEVYFLPMKRSVKHTISRSRLERVAIAALKQNLRSCLPSISLLTDWEVIPWEKYSSLRMGEIGSPIPLSEAIPFPPSPTLWIIGPEGDFTPQEKELLKSKGVLGVSLGALRLRAETAALLALGAIKVRWGF
ncbi:MAG: RsmE family RNA methyltransferase [Bacteroidia bacterium]|nr:16S rRNA (uracil(1498)-N(3))-methyltransferase [Bacteroidia bacterium]MDW8015739.1 RsmE family RNA methyltransferase [Bacteroidia bacterium]